MERLRDIRMRLRKGSGARLAVLAYVAAWIAGAAIVTAVLVAALDDGADENVALPPVRETALASAAQRAGCQLRRVAGGERVNPPVSGPAARPAAAGFYEEPVAVPSLVGALRRGVVVIHYRRGLDPGHVDVLRTIQAALPAGTIVVPEQTGMAFEVAATAYGRLLGCRRFGARTIDAVRLFRGRFVGSGPDT